MLTWMSSLHSLIKVPFTTHSLTSSIMLAYSVDACMHTRALRPADLPALASAAFVSSASAGAGGAALIISKKISVPWASMSRPRMPTTSRPRSTEGACRKLSPM